MRRYIDVTVPFRDGMMCFPGDPPCRIKPYWEISKGDTVNLSTIDMGSHTGTHIDAPKHFIDNGKAVDELDIRHFIGRAKVFDFTAEAECVDLTALEGLDIGEGDIVLFKTRNSRLMHSQTFPEDFVYITPAAARWLTERRIATLGFDFLSIDKYGSSDFSAHYAILGAGIVIIEGLDLSGVEAGEYEIIALPMLIAGGNGSPVRVFLKPV
jgi:arylformamidase